MDRIRRSREHRAVAIALTLIAVVALAGCPEPPVSPNGGGTPGNGEASNTVAPPIPVWENPWADATLGEWAEYATPAGNVKWTVTEIGPPIRILVEYLDVDAMTGETREPETVTILSSGSEFPWWLTPRDADAVAEPTELADGSTIAKYVIHISADGGVVDSDDADVSVTYWVSPNAPLDGVILEQRTGIVRELTHFSAANTPD